MYRSWAPSLNIKMAAMARPYWNLHRVRTLPNSSPPESSWSSEWASHLAALTTSRAWLCVASSCKSVPEWGHNYSDDLPSLSFWWVSVKPLLTPFDEGSRYDNPIGYTCCAQTERPAQNCLELRTRKTNWSQPLSSACLSCLQNTAFRAQLKKQRSSRCWCRDLHFSPSTVSQSLGQLLYGHLCLVWWCLPSPNKYS